MKFIVRKDQPNKYVAPAGSTVTIVNQDNVDDVYFDTDPGVLMTVAEGTAPANGTKIAKNGGQLQWPSWRGPVYFRTASAGVFLYVNN